MNHALRFRPGRRGLIAASVAFWAVAAGASGGHPAPAVVWDAPEQEQVVWRGMVSLDGAGNGPLNGVLYPAANAGTFLLAILTHAAMSSGIQSAEQKRQQDEADQVLLPYRAHFERWPASALMRAAALPVADPSSAWSGAVEPRFVLTPGASSLVLDLSARLRHPTGESVPVVVRVVSDTLSVGDPRSHWLAADGEPLHGAVVGLLAHALDLAANEAALRVEKAKGAAALPVEGHTAGIAESGVYRTHRFVLGGQTRFERSQKVMEACGRIVLRTLRGELLSAPAAPPVPAGEARAAKDAACAADGPSSIRMPSAISASAGTAGTADPAVTAGTAASAAAGR